MIDENSTKILIANSQAVYEREEDDDLDLMLKAEIDADCNYIVNAIGTPDFRSVFLMTIPDLKTQDLQIQIVLCNMILQKINEVYNFEFLTNVSIESKGDVNQIYAFLQWLEYDNLEFITLLLTGIISDVRRINIKSFIIDNWERLISRFFVITNINSLCDDFIRTNNKENIISFLTRTIENNRISITEELLKLEIEKGEVENDE